MDLKYYKDKLELAGVEFAPGLTSAEFSWVEQTYQITFPPDLRAFLAFARPVGNDWPDWRAETDPYIVDRLSWPYEGICFDIEHNGFWLDEWGTRPDCLTDAFAIAKLKVDAAPKLIPIYSHRYLPATPDQAGNPVFSVYQTDIIYYGEDLGQYLVHEFISPASIYWDPAPPVQIEFWSGLVERNNMRGL